MSGVVGLVQFLLLTAALFSGVTAVLIAVVYPALRKRLSTVEPTRRARLLTLLAIAPLAVGLVHTMLCFLPGVLGMLWPALDHCAYHAHGDHPHLCAVHPPSGAGTAVGWMAAALVFAVYAIPLVRALRRSWLSSVALRKLVTASREHSEEGVRVIDTSVPLAATTPISADVLISSGLTRALPAQLLAAVVEHERAHLARHDPWRRLVALLASVAHVPVVRRRLLADLDLACEQACDERAADRIGSRARVAEALLAVERLSTPFGDPGALATATAFAGSNVVTRVEALLAPPLAGGGRTEARWLMLVLAVSVALTDPLHHAAETIVGLIGA